MKYFAILKDSWREAIDSKVLFVTMAISLLVILIALTLKLDPLPATRGMQNIANRFTKNMEVEVPVFGKYPLTEPLVDFKAEELENVNQASKPWAAEYQFSIEATDIAPRGFRIIVFWEIMLAEAKREQAEQTGKKTRIQEFSEDFEKDFERLNGGPDDKKFDRSAKGQRYLQLEVRKLVTQHLEQKAGKLKNEEIESFIRQQLENQGNWTVTDVRLGDKKTIQIEVPVVTQEGNDIKISSQPGEGEINTLKVTVKSRSGTFRVWPHKATLFFGSIPLHFGEGSRPGELIYDIEKWLVCWAGGWVIMLLSCIITAFYVPNMLHKGTIDFLLAKPISRWNLLVFKYLGGLTFMFLNTSLLVGGLWLVIGFRSGIWELSFLLMIPLLTFQFALFYAVSTLTAVLTRSPIVSILSCVLLWALLIGMGLAYWGVNLVRPAPGQTESAVLPKWAITTVDTAHGILPHCWDLGSLSSKMLDETLRDPSEEERKKLDKDYEHYQWNESLIVSSIYIVLIVGFSCWRFSAKDY